MQRCTNLLGLALLCGNACASERLHVTNDSKHSVVLTVVGQKPKSLPPGFKGGFPLAVKVPSIDVVVVGPAGTRRASCPCPRNTDVLELRILADDTLDCGGS